LAPPVKGGREPAAAAGLPAESDRVGMSDESWRSRLGLGRLSAANCRDESLTTRCDAPLGDPMADLGEPPGRSVLAQILTRLLSE